MTVTHIGSLTLGETIPGPVAAISATVPDLQAQVSALVAFKPAAINFAADLELAESIVASLKAGISAGITPPSIDAQIGIVASQLAALRLKLESVLSLTNLFGAAGVHAYAYAGAVNAFGGELGAELTGGLPGGAPTDNANALVLVTTTPATWDALSQVFKVTP